MIENPAPKSTLNQRRRLLGCSFGALKRMPRGLSKSVISRVISTLNWSYPNYNPTYNRLSKSSGPPSRHLCKP